MWVVANRDERQRNRTIMILKDEGVVARGVGDESEFDELGQRDVTLLLFYEGWNLVTVRRMQEKFHCKALWIENGTVSPELIQQKLQDGYADVLCHPPRPEAARQWERHEEQAGASQSRRSTYTKSDLSPPPLNLEALRGQGPRGKIIAFVSYGGAVGKSTHASVAANVLRAAGKTVVLVEVDHSGKQSLLHGIVPQVTIGSFERLSSDTPEPALRMHMIETKYHWDLVPRGQGEPPISINTLLKAIYLCSRYHDYVILDCHPDTNPLSMVSAKEADFVFIMTTDDVSRYGGIDELVEGLGLKGDPKAHLIINNFRSPRHAKQIATDIKRTHQLGSAHLIPHDKELYRRIQAREAVLGRKSHKLVKQIFTETGVL